jgi:hypothetical protein
MLAPVVNAALDVSPSDTSSGSSRATMFLDVDALASEK